MSDKYVEWALDQWHVTPAPRNVLSILALLADEEGKVQVPLNEIATVLNITRRSVRRFVTILAEAGLLTREYQYTEKNNTGGQAPNLIQLFPGGKL